MNWKRLGRRSVVVIAGLAASYTLLGAVGLPLLARQAIKDWEAQTPGLNVQLRRITFNPWTWTLRAGGLQIIEAGQTLVTLDELVLSLSLHSLLRGAVVLDEIDVRRPTAALHWDAHGHLDLEQILPHVSRKRGPHAGGGSVPWQIDHLAISDLRLSVVDPAAGLDDALVVTLPNFDLDHIGTLHGGDDNFTLDLHGRYDNKPVWDLHWQGDIDFAPFSSNGRVELSHLSLPWLDESLGHRWPLSVATGELDIHTDYQLDEVQGERRLQLRKADLDLRRFAVSGKEKPTPAFSFRQLHIGLTGVDTLKHQLIGESLVLDAPDLLVHRDPDGELDVVRLLGKWPGAKPKATPAASATSASALASAWSLSWPLVELRDGNLQFHDELATGFGPVRLLGLEAKVQKLQTVNDDPLQIELRGDIPTQGKQAEHGHWGLHGGLTPRSRKLHLDWQVKGVELPQLNALLARVGETRVKQGVLTAEGTLDTDLNDERKLRIVANAQLRNADLLAPSLGELRDQELDVGPLRYRPGNVELDALHVLNMHAGKGDRSVDMAGLDAEGGSVDFKGPQVRLRQLRLSGLAWDGGSAMSPRPQGQQTQLSLEGMDWDGASKRATLQGVLASPGGLNLLGGGRSLRLSWNQIDLESLDGDLVAQHYALGAMSGHDWSMQGKKLTWVLLPQVNLGAVQADLAQHRLALGPLTVSGGQVQLLRRQDGGLQPLLDLQAIAGQPAAPAATPGAATKHGLGAAANWKLTADGIDIGLSSLQLLDHQNVLPPLQATGLRFKTGAWANIGTEAVQEHLTMTLDQGLWQWDGTVIPEPLSVDGKFSIQHADLAPLQTVLNQTSYVGIDHGSLSAAGKLSLRDQGGKLQTHFEGSVEAGDTRFVDNRDQQTVLSWHDVDVPQLTLDWPGGVQAPQLNIDGLFSRIIIQPDHRANWETLARPKLPPAGGAPAPETVGAPPFIIRVGAVSLNKAGADFSDNSLRLPFEATVHDMAGTIGPFASDTPDAWTSVALQGNVSSDGRVEVSGRVMPLDLPLRLELGVHFMDIQMPTLNPYAAQFAGYRIDQGMLDLRLQYTLDQGRIEGSNTARIDQLVLGPRVAGTTAHDLPIRAMIDILRNDDGVIDLDVPVHGDLNDPSLTMRDIVFTALEGVLRRALESPFTLIASLLGSDVDTLRHVGFNPGTDALTAKSLARLQDIAGVLGKHDKMLILIHPGFDPGADAQTLPPPAPTSTPPGIAPAPADKLRALALRRAETIKTALKKSGIRDERIFIDEPNAGGVGKSGAVLTTLDLKLP